MAEFTLETLPININSDYPKESYILISALRSALIAAENSGFSNNYSIDNIINKLSE